jgi:hypothetical protein
MLYVSSINFVGFVGCNLRKQLLEMHLLKYSETTFAAGRLLLCPYIVRACFTIFLTKKQYLKKRIENLLKFLNKSE